LVCSKAALRRAFYACVKRSSQRSLSDRTFQVCVSYFSSVMRLTKRTVLYHRFFGWESETVVIIIADILDNSRYNCLLKYTLVLTEKHFSKIPSNLLVCNFRFLSKMQHGFADYGCCIQTEKTVTNFDWKSQDVTTDKPVNPPANVEIRPSTMDLKQGKDSRKPVSLSDPLELAFCGSLIDPLSLCCRPDFSSYFGRNIVYASTLNCWYLSNNFTSWFAKA